MGAHDQGAEAISGRWIVIPRTLSLITHGDDILLLKRGAQKRVFPNKYNGIGGHIEKDEDPMTSALREIEEETGLQVKNIQLRGVINIHAGHSSGIMLLVFTAEALSRDFRDSDEGTLEWIPLSEVYNRDLVEDFPYLLPRLFGDGVSSKMFFAHSSYDADDQLVLKFYDAS